MPKSPAPVIRHIVNNTDPGKPYQKPVSPFSWACGGIFVGLMAALGAMPDAPQRVEINEATAPVTQPVQTTGSDYFSWNNEDPAKAAARKAEIARRDAAAYARIRHWRQQDSDADEEELGNQRAAEAKIESTRLAIQAAKDRLSDIRTETFVKQTERLAEDIRQINRQLSVPAPAPNITVNVPERQPDNKMYVRGPVVGVVPYGGVYGRR